jgi:hypothetical protein
VPVNDHWIAPLPVIVPGEIVLLPVVVTKSALTVTLALVLYVCGFAFPVMLLLLLDQYENEYVAAGFAVRCTVCVPATISGAERVYHGPVVPVVDQLIVPLPAGVIVPSVIVLLDDV